MDVLVEHTMQAAKDFHMDKVAIAGGVASNKHLREAMEKACKENNTPGRIIPVPRAISAGCGLSWCAALDEREEIVAMMEKVGIEPEDLHECLV